MSASNQQTLAESGATDRPLILEKGNYIPCESRFLENKGEDGEQMWNSIKKGPYERLMIIDPDDPYKMIPEPLSKMTEANKKRYSNDVRVMNYLLQAIPNDIYNLVDACKDAQKIWKRIKRLMYGLKKNKHVIHSRLMNEFNKFDAKEGESLESVYERLSTLMNVMDHNDVCPLKVSINTKFLYSLQAKRSKYVTLARQNKDLSDVEYDWLYDTLLQFEPHVQASKAKRAAKNHDPLALIAHSNAYSLQSHASPSYSHSPQPYYVTHLSSVADFEEDYQRKLQGDAQRQAHNSNDVISSSNYPEIDESHYARDCPKPKVRDAKYFREQMLLAMKDETEGTLNEEEKDFMLDNAYGDETLEELTTAVIMMGHVILYKIQQS
ncbi:hypothetical protein Tco_0174109 [Tanacetum coccineum]